MPSNYNGIADNIGLNMPAPTGIVAVTVSNPAVIQTSPAHGLQIGDDVHIKGHQGRVLVNGIHRVTGVPDSTHFQIGVNAGGTDTNVTGAAQALTIGTYPIPSDGDDVDAAAVNPAEEEMGDRTVYLGVSTGAYKYSPAAAGLVDKADGGTSPTDWAAVAALSGSAWAISPATWTVPDVVVGDIVEVELTTTLKTLEGNSATGAKLYASNVAPSASPSYGSLNGSDQWIIPSSALSGVATSAPITLRGWITITTSGDLDIALYFLSSAGGGGTTVSVVGGHTLSAKVWRPTGMVQ